MAEDSWPNSTRNSGAVTDAEYEKVSCRFADDGLYGSPVGADPVVAGTGLQVLVRANLYASLRGFLWSSGTSDIAKAIDPNTSGQARNDRVVLELDRSTWQIRTKIVKGTPGAGPPVLTRTLFDTGVYQELLGDVAVPNNATAVTVTPRPNYIGLRTRVARSGRHRANINAGEITYEPDTGMWLGHNVADKDDVLFEDTGDLTVAPGSGWSADGSNIGSRLSGQVSIDLNLKRTGAALAESSETVIATVPAALAPLKRNKYFGCVLTGDNFCRLDVGLDGRIVARHFFASLAKDTELRATLNYRR